MDQWEHVAGKSGRFIAVRAVWSDGTLDTTGMSSGLMASYDSRTQEGDDSPVVACELFSGGYSGWTQSMRRLSQLGFQIDHKLAIDIEKECCETFCRSHGIEHMLGPESFVWGHMPLPKSIMVHGDISKQAWIHLLSNVRFDLAVMSPPCPAWSFAASMPGLLRADGRLTLHAWGILSLLRPRVVVMEMVSGMHEHPHWILIKRFIRWCGYSIRWAKTLNLSDVSPQQRNRLILVATLDQCELLSHICTPWPVAQRQTMESYLNVMDISEPWLSQCSLSPDVMQTYLDPNMLPKPFDQRGGAVKRARRDVEEYRIKHPHSIFGCVMGNYSYGHLLPESSLRQAGLYGTLLALPTGLRFLSIPEILISQSTLVSCWLPDDHRTCIKMLGNSIATPHALIGLINALAFLHEDLSGAEVQQVFVECLSMRMTSQNIKWERTLGGHSFRIDDTTCAPTLHMHSMQRIIITSPMDSVIFFGEKGVNIEASMKSLLGISMPNDVFLMPGGNLEARITMQPRMEINDYDVQLFSNVPVALNVDSNDFATSHCQAGHIIILTKQGPHVLRRDHGMTIHDVVTIIDHCCGIRCTHLVGIFGERHPPLMICPNAAIAMDYESVPDDLDILEFISVQSSIDGIVFSAAWAVLKDLSRFLQRTCLIDIIQAFGWMLVVDAQAVVNDEIQSFQLVKRPAALSLTHDDLTYCIAIHLFLLKIRTWSVAGEHPAVRCKIKLWHVVIWDAMVDPSISLNHFDQVWKDITHQFQIQKPWRFVINGQQVNPAWPLTGFVQNDDLGNAELKVFMILGLRGGGPAKLLTNDEVEVSGNFRDISHMESSNFEAALSVALNMIIDFRAPRSHHDITEFLELYGSLTEGLFTINGDYQLLRKLMILMKDTGIEKTLARCGWITAFYFTSFGPPEIAQIIFVQRPRGPTTSIKFVQALLRSALVFLGMPVPYTGDDSVLTKIKLWGATLFHDNLPRMFQMQELLDLWDQASTIVGNHTEMRLVSHARMVNPDLALKNYSKCGPDDKTTALITYVGVLKGGGPVTQPPSNQQELNIQQRNGLATFLMSQGADLKECLSFIDSIVRGAGAGAVASILGQKSVSKKWDGLSQLAMALHISMPQVGEKIKLAKKKAQQKFQSQSRTLPANIPVECLTIQNGYIRYADDTPCSQLTKIAPNSSGVILMRYDEARPWLDRQVVLSQDELVLVVIGKCEHEQCQQCRKIQLPVCYNDEPLILQACLHQMGTKHAVVSSDEDMVIPECDTQVISITGVRSEMSQECWDLIARSPVKQMMKTLGEEIAEISFVSPPWGRSFQKNLKRVAPEMAQTVQFHARINSDDLKSFLRASGNGGVYTCPKTEDKKISSDFLIVWLKASEVDMAVHLSQCDNHFGLVRSFKNDNSAKGIRFAKADFPNAFAKLRPHDKMPNLTSPNFFFRIEPIPNGSTSEHVQAWIDQHDWKAKPVRPLNSTAWLCVAEKKFSDQFPQWNCNPILVTWIQSRSDQKPVILAGNMHKVFQFANAESASELSSEIAPLQSDPWGAWIKNHGATGIANGSSASKPTLPASFGVQPPRKVESPIEDKFQRQDDQIQALRADTQKELAVMRENVTRLEQAIESQKQTIDANMEMTTNEFATLRAETGNQFQVMADLFKDSLKTAIASHDSTMSAQFEELKSMIASGSNRSSPLPKKPKTGTASDDPYQQR